MSDQRKQEIKEKLAGMHRLPMEEQKRMLKETIIKWKGEYEQIDDILVMGVRF